MMKDLKENLELRLRAEISALIHDFGKLSEEFISQQSSSTTYDKYLFRHNLILGRSIQPTHEIVSEDGTKIDLSKHGIYSIENELRKYIHENSCRSNDKDLKQFIKNKYCKNLSNTKAEKQADELLYLIREHYSYRKISDENQNGLLIHLCQNLLIFKTDTIGFADIIAKHHKGEKYQSVLSVNFLKMFREIDGIDSGIDKGALNDCGKQPKDKTYFATSFGHEIHTIDISNLNEIRDNLCKQLSDNLGTGGDITDIRNNIHEIIKGPFLHGLGDTRRSGNDVTLWDHSYSVASLYKSALAKIIHENKWTEPHKIKWRIIAVQYDKLGLIEKAHKLGDIIGYRKLTKEVDTAIKKIIEEDIAIGNEIYRDETGIYFTGPDINSDEWFNPIKKQVLQEVQKITDGEVIPYITLDKSSRSLVNLTKLLKKSKYNFLCQEEIPDWMKTWKDASTNTVKDTNINRSYCKNQCQNNHNCIALNGSNEYQIDICPVCKVHPKCEHQNICKHCLERRESRIKEWQGGKYQTIWIDEIADKNKKVAIITGMFNIFGWLNGELLNTVFSQTLEDYEKTDYNSLINLLKKCLESNEYESSLLNKIANDAYKNQASHKFYNAIVADRNPTWSDAEINWDNDPDYQKASEYLLLTLFRKHPSPARLRRIWETTQNFWIDVQDKLKNKNVLKYKNENDLNGEEDIRFKRLEIKLNNKPPVNILYNVKFGKYDILMYFDGNKLISIQNLTFSGLKKDLDKYKHEIILIKREDENDSEFKKNRINEILYSKEQYNPFLKILLSPISFQFIVPATSVPSVMQLIQDKYSAEMGEVYGRLPLNMGAVIFDHKTPLYAAINASRKMLQGFEDKPAEKFIVKSTNNNGFVEFVNNDNGKSIEFDKPIEKSSRYYRNFIVENPTDIEDREGYFKSYIDSEERGLLNASEIEKNDEVMLYTNHFDFEFLDTTTRRLEIRYNNKNYKRINQSELRGPRPYYLEEFNTVFDKVWKIFDVLTSSQIKKIQSQIAKLHLDWAGYENYGDFKIQIENILINLGTRKWWNSIEEDDQMLLTRVCCDKTIFDVLEFYNSILKLKPSGDKE